jgi:ribonuclease VapC
VIVDSSALIAILKGEPERDQFGKALVANEPCSVSASTALEASLVVFGLVGDEGLRNLDRLLADFRIEIVPFTAAQLQIARNAFRRFGKGRHPAGLNFGDCFAYALAKERSEPLLFKGEDFAQTDIEAARY